MNYRIITVIFTALAIMVSTAYASKTVKVEDLPKNIVKIIKKAFPLIEIEKAKVTDKRGTKVYKIKGEYEADGGDYELEITIDESGKILKIEEEFEDDDD